MSLCVPIFGGVWLCTLLQSSACAYTVSIILRIVSTEFGFYVRYEPVFGGVWRCVDLGILFPNFPIPPRIKLYPRRVSETKTIKQMKITKMHFKINQKTRFYFFCLHRVFNASFQCCGSGPVLNRIRSSFEPDPVQFWTGSSPFWTGTEQNFFCFFLCFHFHGKILFRERVIIYNIVNKKHYEVSPF